MPTMLRDVHRKNEKKHQRRGKETKMTEANWEGDKCEKCGSKDFDRFYSGGYNFMTCKKCGAEYLDE